MQQSLFNQNYRDFAKRGEVLKAFWYGEYQKVLTLLKTHWKDDSRDHEMLYIRATCSFALDDIPSALIDLDKAIVLNQEDCRYYFQRYLVHLKLRNETFATKDIERAGYFDDTPAEYFFHLGKDQFKRRLISLAENSIEMACFFGFYSEELERLRGLILCELEKFNEAVESLKKVIGTSQADVEVYSAIAFSYYRMGLIEMNSGSILLGMQGATFSRLYGELLLEAIGYYRTAIIKDDARASSYFYRGMAYKYIGNIESAQEDLSSAIRLEPTQEVFYEEWEKLRT